LRDLETQKATESKKKISETHTFFVSFRAFFVLQKWYPSKFYRAQVRGGVKTPVVWTNSYRITCEAIIGRGSLESGS